MTNENKRKWEPWEQTEGSTAEEWSRFDYVHAWFMSVSESSEHPWAWVVEWCATEVEALFRYESHSATKEEAVSAAEKWVSRFSALVEPLTYVVSPSGNIPNVWIGHCLEVDIVSHGTPQGGPEDALRMTLEATALFVSSLMEEGRDPCTHMAPPEFWPRRLLPTTPPTKEPTS